MVRQSPPEESLTELVEDLKVGLYDAVTHNKGDFEDEEYRRIRKLLISNPATQSRLPHWLHEGTTLREVKSVIIELAGDEPGKWRRREKIVRDGISPLLADLESQEFDAQEHLVRGERIGGGGFGEVYKYHHRLLDIPFAVKVLQPAFAPDRDRSLERFFREARILFQLHHPHIVRIYDVGVLKTRPFIRMEFVDGHTLIDQLSNEGSLASDEVRSTVLALARALHHAHEEIGVVHRDLKPSNVMIDAAGRVVLLDFGMGIFVEDDIVSRVTKTGEVAVAGLYTAPELIADASLVDPATDIYSLGAVWFTLLAGRAPAGAAIETAIDSVADLLDDEKTLLLRCLQDAADRPTAQEIATELEPYL